MNGSKQLVSDVQKALDAAGIAECDCVVCPPYPFIAGFTDLANVGVQNVSALDNGAHTGEVSAQMVAELGVRYAIIGHSERRADNHESNDIVAHKVHKALQLGLTPILCVGESLQTRESGKLYEFIAEQLDAVIRLTGIEQFAKIVVAYEPIWAIGTGKTASPQQAQDVHAFIRGHLARQNAEIAESIRIIYGGSVKAANAKELFSQPDVDGGLIGGASLDPQEFIKICQAAN